MYTDKEREIFQYRLNGQSKAIDPIAAMRVIQIEEPDLEADFIDISLIGKTADTKQMEALTRILKACRVAFGLKEFADGEGYLDCEVLEVMVEFFLYLDELKKKSVTSPISSASTVAT